MTEPVRVLFVCTANICRSPFMEIYARSVVSPGVQVSSAGTYGLHDQPMGSEMQIELESRGLTAGGFRSRPVTAGLIDAADLVITAERVHRQFILDEHPDAFKKVLTLGQAVRGAQAVPAAARGGASLPVLAQHRGVAGQDDDVADPFRRGPAAAAAAAEQITAMLDQFLPVLISVEGENTHG